MGFTGDGLIATSSRNVASRKVELGGMLLMERGKEDFACKVFHSAFACLLELSSTSKTQRRTVVVGLFKGVD